MKEEHKRHIRSFVRRQGRMSTAQTEALDKHWPQKGLTLDDGELDFAKVFGNTNPVTLEIGFGMGASLAELVKTHPDKNYIGIDVHRPGVGALLLATDECDNLRVYCEDAIKVLNQSIAAGSLDAVLLFFPDPWPKKRHHKRRIIQGEFVELIASKLKAGGVFHMATDWENYAEHMMEVMSASQSFNNEAGAGQFSQRPDSRPVTKYEKRGQRLGHGVWDLVFVKK